MAQPERNKTDCDKAREEALITRLVEVNIQQRFDSHVLYSQPLRFLRLPGGSTQK